MSALSQYDSILSKLDAQRNAVTSQGLTLLGEPGGSTRSTSINLAMNRGHYGVTAFCDDACSGLTLYIMGEQVSTNAAGWASVEFDVPSYQDVTFSVQFHGCSISECFWRSVVFY